MNIDTLKESRFFKKEDCGPITGPGVLLTIMGDHMENLAMDGAPADMACVLEFAEPVKPMVLKPVNADVMAMIFGSKETADWRGKKIVLFNDPSVQMKGKTVGGIRCRAPRGAAARPAPAPAPVAPPPPAAPEPGLEDDLPF